MRFFDLSTNIIRRAVLAALLLVIVPAAFAQEGNFPLLEQTLAEKTATFEAVNPYSGIPGNVTVTTSGTFRVKKITSGRKAGWSSVTGEQEGNFTFVPYDSSQPTFSGTFKFNLVGQIAYDRHSDALSFDFIIKTGGSDGSKVTFTLSETATVNEYGANASFGELKRLDSAGAGEDKQ